MYWYAVRPVVKLARDYHINLIFLGWLLYLLREGCYRYLYPVISYFVTVMLLMNYSFAVCCTNHQHRFLIFLQQRLPIVFVCCRSTGVKYVVVGICLRASNRVQNIKHMVSAHHCIVPNSIL